MKTIKTSLVALLLIASSITVFAGGTPKTFSDFYKKYKQHEESFSMNIPGILFQWGLDDEEAKEIAEDISNVKLLVIEDLNQTQRKLMADLKDYFPKSVYQDLMIIKDGKDQITLKFREGERKNNELVVLIQDEDSLFSLCITGEVDAEGAKKLVQSIDMNDLKKDL